MACGKGGQVPAADCLESVRLRDVRAALDSLLANVVVGSELLYDGLPASSLDGQPLATDIVAHFARLAIPSARELRRGLRTASGLCIVCCAGRSKPFGSRPLMTESIRLR